MAQTVNEYKTDFAAPAGNTKTSSAYTITAGAAVLILVACDQPVTINTPVSSKGDTVTAMGASAAVGTDNQIRGWYIRNAIGGTGNTFTVSASGTFYGSFYVLEIPGSDTTAPFDSAAYASATSSSGSPFAVTSGTPAQSDYVAVSLCGTNGGSNPTTYTPTAGWSSDSQPDGSQYWTSGCAWKIVTGGSGTVPISWTVPSSGGARFIVLIKAAAGGGGTTFTKTLSASVTTSAARIAAAQAIRAASVSSAAALARQGRLVRSASASTTAAVQRKTNAVRSAASASTAALSAIKTRLLTLTASVTTGAARVLSVQALRYAAASSSGSAQRTVQAIRSASTAAGASVQRRSNLLRMGAVVGVAAISTVKAKLLTLAASVSTAASLGRTIQAVRTASTAAGGFLAKRVNMIRFGTLNAGASLGRAIAAVRTAVQASAATLVISRARFLALTASVATSASVRKVAAIIRGASTISPASLIASGTVVVRAMLVPVVRAVARLTAWLVPGRNTQLQAEKRSTVWVVGGKQTMIDTCEKRTSEQVTFTIDCTPLLDPNETILQAIGTITADQGNLAFGTPSINAAQIVTKDGRIIAPRKAIQVEIDGGVIPAGRSVLLCYVRPVFSTTLDGASVYNPKREATVVLRLIDNPPA